MKSLRTVLSRARDADFWELVDLLDWENEGDDEKVIEPVVVQLASLPVKTIRDFQETLAQKLYALDGKIWAEESGPTIWRHNGLASADGFLYARCVVVANGRDYYDRVLDDPKNMPKDMEFEALIYIAGEALKRKTGDDSGVDTQTSFETYANHNGWLEH